MCPRVPLYHESKGTEQIVEALARIHAPHGAKAGALRPWQFSRLKLRRIDHVVQDNGLALRRFGEKRLHAGGLKNKPVAEHGNRLTNSTPDTLRPRVRIGALRSDKTVSVRMASR